MLIAAATETTAASLANLLACVLSDPPLVVEVVNEPALAGFVVDEALRWAPPLHTTLRLTARELVLGSVIVPANAPIQLVLASGNRDAEIFADGENWNPRRKPPRPALSFGAGSHHCMGFNLARAELCIFLQEFLQSFPSCHLLGAPQVTGRTFRLPAALPVELCSGHREVCYG
jgi:cytochrome P450